MSKLSPTDIIESLIFASEKPVPLKKLAQILELTPEEAQAELDIVREEKERIGSLQLVEVQGGWQLVTKPEFSSHIRQLRDAPRQKLSRAAFEVLAITAYRQPCTRSDIEALRGVDCGGSVQFLLEKKLIAFAGRKETPGRPHLFATTPQFLDHFGLRDIADLPSLSELSELNEKSLIHDGDSLFNRGAMKSPEEAAEEAAVEMAAQHHEEELAAEAAALAAAEGEGSEPDENEAQEGEKVESSDEKGAVEEDSGETEDSENTADSDAALQAKIMAAAQRAVADAAPAPDDEADSADEELKDVEPEDEGETEGAASEDEDEVEDSESDYEDSEDDESEEDAEADEDVEVEDGAEEPATVEAEA